MSYMNEFKFSDRRDMRSAIWQCITFALYKYILKLLRLFALFYNLIHYFPREKTPLIISDRALPQFIDDSQVHLSTEEANKDSIREIRNNIDTGQTLVMREDHPDGKEVDMVPDPVTGSLRTADARTVEIMQNTGDYVTFEGDWKIVRPKHFMLRQSSWVLRRWTWNAETGTMEWNEFDEKQDKGGGVGLEHDLERLALTLSWAKDLTNPSHNGEANVDARNAIEAPDDARLSAHVVGSGDAEKRKNEIQCAVALGNCIDSCFGSIAALKEMQKQGKRRSGREDARLLLETLNDSRDMLNILIRKGNIDQINEARNETRRNIKFVRKTAASLSPWKMDPEGDATAVICVFFSFALGGGLAYNWKLLSGSSAKHIVEALGMPMWTQDWLWFSCMFSVACLVLFCSVLCPLTIAWLTKQKGHEIPLHKKE